MPSSTRFKSVEPPAFTVGYAATAIPARLVLERRRWKEAASLEFHDNVRGFAPLDNFAWGRAHVHFARAVGAARSGEAGSRARDEIAKLKDIEQALVIPPGTYDWRTQVSIERQVADAWVAHADGRKDEALRLMRAAADLDDATEKHPVTPGAVLPAREQLGELLLELGRPAEAMREYRGVADARASPAGRALRRRPVGQSSRATQAKANNLLMPPCSKSPARVTARAPKCARRARMSPGMRLGKLAHPVAEAL